MVFKNLETRRQRSPRLWQRQEGQGLSSSTPKVRSWGQEAGTGSGDLATGKSEGPGGQCQQRDEGKSLSKVG